MYNCLFNAIFSTRLPLRSFSLNVILQVSASAWLQLVEAEVEVKVPAEAIMMVMVMEEVEADVSTSSPSTVAVTDSCIYYWLLLGRMCWT